MVSDWPSTPLNSEAEALAVLSELCGKRWLCRGQSKHHALVPLIDRDELKELPRPEKLSLERQSINLFQSNARFFANSDQQVALNDDIVALMMLRHNGVPTRLLDWSTSPYVAAYFAVHEKETEDGEIWTFDHRSYAEKGRKQWDKWPKTKNEKGEFDAKLTAFATTEPDEDWIVCGFYPSGFPRQNAQHGLYTLTARFGRDHADCMARLLEDSSCYHLYKLSAALKTTLRQHLRERHGIWRGALFPDAAGAAEIASLVFKARGKA